LACSHISNCPLYPLFRVQALLNIWKLNYCEGDFSKCARFQKSERGEPVPVNLLPNGQLLAGATK
jgi:hypothetical protein